MINELRGYWFLEHFLISSVGNDHLVLSVLTGFFFFFFPQWFIPVALKRL